MQPNRLLAALVLAGALIPAAAGAVTTTTVVATDGQQAVPRSSVQLFDTATGAEVKQEEDDDDGAAVFLLPQGSYRVVINGTPVEEFTVTGEGTRTVTVSVGGAAGLSTASAHGGPEIYVGVDGAWLWDVGDQFYAASGVDPDDLAQPDRGFGGRLFGAVEFEERYLVRGTLNGAWLMGDLRESSGGGVSEEEAQLDMLWATLDFYRLWSGRAWLFGLGGGLEYADVRHRFESMFDDGMVDFHVRQESGFWGVGPRVAGFVEHDLFRDVRGFAEGGVSYLFGDREIAIRAGSGGSSAELQDSSGERLWHYGLRVGVRREFNLDGLNFTLYGGWQYEAFQDAINLEFLNEMPGDASFHGPFVGVGVRWGG